MINIFIPMVAFLVGGIFGRIRGQHMPWNDTVARYVIWGVPVGLVVLVTTLNPYYFIVTILLAGLGASLGYYGEFDLSEHANRNLKNYAILTATGMFRFLPLFIASLFVHLQWSILPAVLAGVSFVPSYLLALKMPLFPNCPLFNQFTCWGEFFFWGIIFTALTLGLVWI